MTFIVATNVVASRLPERRLTGTPHAHANLVIVNWSAQKPLSQPRWTFCAPMAAISEFAGGMSLQVVSERLRHHYVGTFVYRHDQRSFLLRNFPRISLSTKQRISDRPNINKKYWGIQVLLINQDLSSPPFTFPTPLPCPVPDIAMIVLNCGTEEYLTSMQGCRFAFKYNYWLYLYWQIDRCCTQYYIVRKFKEMLRSKPNYCQTPVLCLGLGVDFTFAWDNNNKNNDKKW